MAELMQNYILITGKNQKLTIKRSFSKITTLRLLGDRCGHKNMIGPHPVFSVRTSGEGTQ